MFAIARRVPSRKQEPASVEQRIWRASRSRALVAIEFEDLEACRAFYCAKTYQDSVPLGRAVRSGRLFLNEGATSRAP